MNDVLKERKGNRTFQRISRWNSIDSTLISKNNRFAKYADKIGTGDAKLDLTYFKLKSHMYPLNMFGKLMETIMLEDLSVLSRQDVENNIYYLEISPEKDKVRLYKEI